MLYRASCLGSCRPGAEPSAPAGPLAAAEGHGLVLAAGLDVQGPTPGAAYVPSRPALLDEPVLSGLVVGEFPEKLDEGDALSEPLARSLRCLYASILPL